MLKHFIAQEVKWLSTETLIFIITKPVTVPSFSGIHDPISTFTFLFTSGVLLLFSVKNVKNGTSYHIKQTTLKYLSDTFVKVLRAFCCVLNIWI